MEHLLTLAAENAFVIIGFALYGVLMYYMIAKAFHRNSERKKAKIRKKLLAARRAFYGKAPDSYQDT